MAARWTTRWKLAVGFGSAAGMATRPVSSLSMNSAQLAGQLIDVNAAGTQDGQGILIL